MYEDRLVDDYDNQMNTGEMLMEIELIGRKITTLLLK